MALFLLTAVALRLSFSKQLPRFFHLNLNLNLNLFAQPFMILGSIIWCCGQIETGFW